MWKEVVVEGAVVVVVVLRLVRVVEVVEEVELGGDLTQRKRER